jgi:hypothetical protein
MGNNRGIANVLYIAILFFLGVLLNLYWVNRTRYLSIVSNRFEQTLVELLQKQGVKQEEIVVLRKYDHDDSDESPWTGYSREIKLPKKIDEEGLCKKINEAAEKQQLSFEKKKEKDGSVLIRISLRDKLFSQILLASDKKQK